MPLRGNKIFPVTQTVVAVFLLLQGGLLVAVARWFLKQRRVNVLVAKVEVLEDKRSTNEGMRVAYETLAYWKDQIYRTRREHWFRDTEEPLYPKVGREILCYVPWYPFVEFVPTFEEEARSLESLAFAFGIASLVAGGLVVVTAWLGRAKPLTREQQQLLATLAPTAAAGVPGMSPSPPGQP